MTNTNIIYAIYKTKRAYTNYVTRNLTWYKKSTVHASSHSLRYKNYTTKPAKEGE
jgi:hypothetical protein